MAVVLDGKEVERKIRQLANTYADFMPPYVYSILIEYEIK